MGKAKGSAKTSQPAKKVIHPKSREAKRQNRHMVRNEHVTKKKVDHAKILHTKRRTLEWFHDNLDKTKTLYTDEEMIALIKEFIERHEIEKEFLKGYQRPGEPLASSKANKVAAMEKCRQEEELMLYKTGFEAPDLTTAKKMQKFKEWTKTLQYIHDLPLKKYLVKQQAPGANAGGSSNEMEQ